MTELPAAEARIWAHYMGAETPPGNPERVRGDVASAIRMNTAPELGGAVDVFSRPVELPP